jgi:hypothetical protein
MGLDMYLTANEYVSRTQRDPQGLSYDTPKENELFYNLADRRKGWVDNAGYAGISISYPVGYWRKANAIHNWFVQNVQDDRDECQKSYVSPQNLRDLREACQAVLATKNNSLVSVQEVAIDVGLAPKAGFFFGSQEYDEWYFGDLEYTVTTINRLEGSGLFDNAWTDIEYQASW